MWHFRLPWQSENDKYEVCDNTSSKVVEFNHIWSRLITLDEVEIYRDIGCMRKCRRMEWKAKTVYENQGRDSINFKNIMKIFPKFQFVKE